MVPVDAAANPNTGYVYVANYGNGPNTGTAGVSVINSNTGQVTAAILIDAGVSSLAVDTSTNRIYAVSGGNNGVSVIDGNSNTVTNTLLTGLTNVDGISIDPINHLMLAVTYNGTVQTYSTLTNTPGASSLIGGTLTQIATNTATGISYILSANTDTLYVVQDDTLDVLQTIPVGSGSSAVAVNPDTNLIYVINSSDNTVSVINGNTNQVTGTIPLSSSPKNIAIDAETNLIYVTNEDSSVSVIDGAENTVTANIAVQSNPQGLDILRVC
jgi:YVTN family beta-propeller protein